MNLLGVNSLHIDEWNYKTRSLFEEIGNSFSRTGVEVGLMSHRVGYLSVGEEHCLEFASVPLAFHLILGYGLGKETKRRSTVYFILI